MSSGTGKIIAVKGQVAEVFFSGEKPSLHDIVVVEKNPSIKMQVHSSSGQDTYYCLLLTDTSAIARGAAIINTRTPIMVPVGEEVLGRVIDYLGAPRDGGKNITTKDHWPIYRDGPIYSDLGVSQKMIITGIKGLDLFSPILLTEIIHNIIEVATETKGKSLSVFAGIGERSREGQELVESLDMGGILPSTSLVLGPMGENPAIRFLTGYTALTIAEHFRDVLKKDVIFFADNVFRYAQAGNELSLLMDMIPSEDSYQATLSSEMATFHERLSSTNENSITSIEAIYIPNDDILDQGVQSILPYLDSTIILSRTVYQEGRLPAIDYTLSTSSALTPELVGEEHYKTALLAQSVLKKAVSIERIASLVGEAELNPEDRKTFRRAKILRNYMTQNFFTVEKQTGKKGNFIPIETTVKDAADILKGVYDDIPEEKFLYIGAAEEAKK